MTRRALFFVLSAWLLSSVPAMAAGSGDLTVYFGNLHSHCAYSDGVGLPEEAYRYAREQGGLDFLALTEHSHRWAEGYAGDRRDGLLIGKDSSLYVGPDRDALIPAAQRMSRDGEFIAIYGQEFSSISSGNHVNVYEVTQVIDVWNGKYHHLLRSWLPRHRDSLGKPAIVQFNHPRLLRDKSKEYGLDDFPSFAAWLHAWKPHAVLMEILNGPHDLKSTGFKPRVQYREWLAYLNRGVKLAPTGNQDNHYATWGTVTEVRTGVLAPRLSRSSLLDALRQRRVYATEDRNLRVQYRVNGRLGGDVISPPPETGSELNIEFRIADDDEPDARYQVQVWMDEVGGQEWAAPVASVEQSGDVAPGRWNRIGGVRYDGGYRYLFLHVKQQGDVVHKARVWTAPVWLQPAPDPENSPLEIESWWSDLFTASTERDVYHPNPNCVHVGGIPETAKITGLAAMKGRQRHAGCPQRPDMGFRGHR